MFSGLRLRFAVATGVVRVVSLTLAAEPSWAQSACRGADQRSADMIEQVRWYVTATDGDDAVSRDSLHLPIAAANEVKLVTSDSLCVVAAAAYKADRQGIGSGLSGRVYVVKVRNTYVVHDPQYVPNPAHPGGLICIVFDSKWQRLAMY
jgi:hypothetical protein